MNEKELREVLYGVANFYSNRQFSLDGGDYEGVDRALETIMSDRNAAIREALANEWEHIDADGDDATRVFYWYRDESDRYGELTREERLAEIQSQPNAKEEETDERNS